MTTDADDLTTRFITGAVSTEGFIGSLPFIESFKSNSVAEVPVGDRTFPEDVVKWLNRDTEGESLGWYQPLIGGPPGTDDLFFLHLGVPSETREVEQFDGSLDRDTRLAELFRKDFGGAVWLRIVPPGMNGGAKVHLEWYEPEGCGPISKNLDSAVRSRLADLGIVGVVEQSKEQLVQALVVDEVMLAAGLPFRKLLGAVERSLEKCHESLLKALKRPGKEVLDTFATYERFDRLIRVLGLAERGLRGHVRALEWMTAPTRGAFQEPAKNAGEEARKEWDKVSELFGLRQNEVERYLSRLVDLRQRVLSAESLLQHYVVERRERLLKTLTTATVASLAFSVPSGLFGMNYFVGDGRVRWYPFVGFFVLCLALAGLALFYLHRVREADERGTRARAREELCAALVMFAGLLYFGILLLAAESW